VSFDRDMMILVVDRVFFHQNAFLLHFGKMLSIKQNFVLYMSVGERETNIRKLHSILGPFLGASTNPKLLYGAVWM
jgi:uncharacterized protein YrrD